MAMVTMPSKTLQHMPTNADRRASIDQSTPTDKRKRRGFKGLKDRLLSSKSDGDQEQDVNVDNTSESYQVTNNTPNGNDLTSNTNQLLPRTASLPQNGSLSSPSNRPHYPHIDSGYSGEKPPSLGKQDLSSGNSSLLPLPPSVFPRGHEDVNVENTGTGLYSQVQQNGVSPSGMNLAQTAHQDSFAVGNDVEASTLRLQRVPIANQLPNFADLVNENRSLKRESQLKDQNINNLQQEKEKAERESTRLNEEVIRLTGERDQAVRRHAEVTREYDQVILDLNSRTTDVRTVTKQLEEGKEKWAKREELERQMQGQISALEAEVVAKGRYLENLKHQADAIMAERDRLKADVNQIHELERCYNCTLEQLQELSQQLFTSRRDYEILQQRHSDTSAELMRVKIESQSDVDDAFFVSKFEHLQGDIRTWAQTYFFGEQRKRGVLYSTHNVIEHPCAHDDLEELSEDCRSLLIGLRDGSNRPFIAEAYLWKFIEDKILHTSQSPSSCSKGMFWAHKLRPEMARMEKFLRPGPKVSDTELRMFYKWKASTAKLVIKRLKPNLIERTRIPIDPAVMEYMIKQVWHVLGEWTSNPEKNCRHDDPCSVNLKNILQAAVDFDSHIHEEWSHIFASASPVGFEYRYGFPFNDASMKPAGQYSLGPGELVGTVVSPALIRDGTSTGDSYNEVQEILVPSRVLPQGFSARTQKPRNTTTGGVIMRGLHQRNRD